MKIIHLPFTFQQRRKNEELKLAAEEKRREAEENRKLAEAERLADIRRQAEHDRLQRERVSRAWEGVSATIE